MSKVTITLTEDQLIEVMSRLRPAWNSVSEEDKAFMIRLHEKFDKALAKAKNV